MRVTSYDLQCLITHVVALSASVELVEVCRIQHLHLVDKLQEVRRHIRAHVFGVAAADQLKDFLGFAEVSVKLLVAGRQVVCEVVMHGNGS